MNPVVGAEQADKLRQPEFAVNRSDPSRRLETETESVGTNPPGDHAPGGGRILRGMLSRRPTAVSASSISRFLGLGAGAVVPSITLIEPPACASSDVPGTRSWPQAARRSGS